MMKLSQWTSRVPTELVIAITVAAALRVPRLGDFHNSYYTAAAKSMTSGWSNFFFGSFDPLGVVSVDKPPAALWIQAMSGSILGIEAWSVSLPQLLMGLASIPVLYFLLKLTFSRLSAAIAAFILAVLPASVVMDTRNEPDSLVCFCLILSAGCLIKAIQNSNWIWLAVFSTLLSVAFTSKMFVAFVPLPIFICYFLVASKLPWRQTIIRAISACSLIFLLSSLWIIVVATTPAENRPYVGSTKDNSIFTLTYRYNGLDRFSGFSNQIRANTPDNRPIPNVPNEPNDLLHIQPEKASKILGLFRSPLSDQLGWLLPLGLGLLILVFSKPFNKNSVMNVKAFLREFRNSESSAQSFLWGGWLLISLIVFASASATHSHPYYLVAASAPFAAVCGIGVPFLISNLLSRNTAQRIGIFTLLIGGLVLISYQSWNSVSETALIGFIVLAFIGVTILGNSFRFSADNYQLAYFGLLLAGAAVLIVPIAVSLTSGGRIVTHQGPAQPRFDPQYYPALGQPGQPVPLKRSSNQPLKLPPSEDHYSDGIIRYIKEKSSTTKSPHLVLGTENAREAAIYILADIPTVAIGGFSGRDPIFTPQQFIDFANSNDLRYFALSRGPLKLEATSITKLVTTRWEDVSIKAGLPMNSLYRNPAHR